MCGLVGIVAQHDSVSRSLYSALMVLQHRGQDAAGMATCDERQIHIHKGSGLINTVFNAKEDINFLSGNIGIAHVRYPTSGNANDKHQVQPFYVNSPYGIALAHNGNLVNKNELAQSLFSTDLRHINTDSDSEILLNVLAHELQLLHPIKLESEHIFTAITMLHKRCSGGYAFVATIMGHGLLAVRDPNGIRPMVLGKKTHLGKDSYMVASESVALDILDYELVRDVMPGEAVYITNDGQLHTQVCAAKTKLTPCIFEYVYLARPDSIMDKISVHKARLSMGKKLATNIMQNWPDHDIDVIIPVPDTSRIIALEMAYKMGIKCREGLVKNRYIGRTFIMAGQSNRINSVKQKLNKIDLEFQNKNVLLVDDSIVRGTTSKQIIDMAREAGAKKVYFASAAPPICYSNFYGIDIPSQQELVAHNKNIKQIAATIGADYLIYQKLDDLIASCRAGNLAVDGFETSVFDGKYISE